jgi:hypothetical protein
VVKKKAVRKIVGEVKTDSDVRHVQVQIPVSAYDNGKAIAKGDGLSFAAYVRQALIKQIRADMKEREGR